MTKKYLKPFQDVLSPSVNVPTYVLEYLLGNYCTSDDEEKIEAGIEQVKCILADNYVRLDEADFLFLGIKNVYVHPRYVREYDKLLAGGIWCIVDLTYFYDEDEKGKSPFVIHDITPIQMQNLDKSEILEARSSFEKEE